MPRLLYLRWAQWNALTPFFLIGGHDEHRPWKFDPEFFQIFRRYMWLHAELVPFFYSQHVQASLREGKLMHLGPGKHEFLLGDALLVGVMADAEPRRADHVSRRRLAGLLGQPHRIPRRTNARSRRCPRTAVPSSCGWARSFRWTLRTTRSIMAAPRRRDGARSTSIRPPSHRRRRSGTRAAFPPSVARDRSFVFLTPAEHGPGDPIGGRAEPRYDPASLALQGPRERRGGRKDSGPARRPPRTGRRTSKRGGSTPPTSDCGSGWLVSRRRA